MKRFWILLLGIASGFLALANWNTTSPGIDLNRWRPFPLERIDISRPFDGILAEPNPDRLDMTLTGRAVGGKRWKVNLCLSCTKIAGKGDLDGNGTQDYVFTGGGPFGNGRTTPLYSLTALIMDRTTGLPVPFFTVLYHGEAGLKHVVDMDHDGKAELIVPLYDEHISDPHYGPFCSGHWVTQVYRFDSGEAKLFNGSIGGIRFPFVRNWVEKDCFRSPKAEFAVQPPAFADLETKMASATEAEPVTRIASSKGSIALSSAIRDCRSVENALTVVYDRPEGREISFPRHIFTDHRDGLLARIQQDGAAVRLRGITFPYADHSSCSASLLWATR